MRRLWRTARTWFRGDGDVADELRFHREMKERETGSERAARRAVGNELLWRERARDAWGFRWLDDIQWDLRYALRQFRQSPGFVAVAVGMLALGIGLNTMVFSIVNAVIFRGFYGVKANEQLLYITSFEGCCVSYPDFQDWRAQAQSFSGMALTHGIAAKMGERGAKRENWNATEITSGTFPLVGARPMLGRDFSEADEQAGAAPVAILQHEFWRQRFAGDRGIIGRRVILNGAATEIVGVMPPIFQFPQKNEFWVPLVKRPEIMQRDDRRTWMVVARLRNGITKQAARAEMRAIGKRLEEQYPDTNKGLLPIISSYTEFLYGPGSTRLYLALWGAVGFVLLIACANLANLLLGRALRREREIALRMALGAGRARIVRQLLIESLLLAAAGGVLGAMLARTALQIYIANTTKTTFLSWMSTNYGMDNQAFVYLALISVAAVLLFGLTPALKLVRGERNGSLKGQGRGLSGSASIQRLSNVLVAVEMALAVVLLAGAGLMLKSLWHLQTARLGADATDVVTFNVDWDTGLRPSVDGLNDFYNRLLERLRAVPGVESIALASDLPGDSPDAMRQQYVLEREEAASVARGPSRTAAFIEISPDFFPVFRVPLLAGREFTKTSVAEAIVNQRFAEQNWPGQSPLGKRLRRVWRAQNSQPNGGASQPEWVTIVGVVSDVALNIRRSTFSPIVYVPYVQRPSTGVNIVAKSRIAADDQLMPFRQAIQEIDPNVNVWRLLPMERVLESAQWSNRYYGALFGAFAALALFLASAGLYAVMAHSVGQRTQEIGIRMALGSSARDVLGMVLGQGMMPVACGLALGLAASLVVSRVIESQLVQVSPRDPATLAATAAVLLVAAGLGCWIPARRALRVDPIVALRHE